ncbi:fimbrial protein [Carnobacterium maltaromaticum]|uniref:fimbrial protein n=1 Tax=Carnobacterium maltaromaticum TaxID=2751 RepID=UPI000C78201D|nr:F7-2 fimbrial protein [Carnobacterium maltaromaticum]
MKKTLIALAAVASFGMSSSVMAAAGEGVVNFKGTVVDSACGIAPESADQTIDFGQLSKVHLDADGISMKKDVDIKLVNCVLDDTKKNLVSVTFNGAVLDAAKKELGTAGGTGTAIVMSGPNGDVVFGTANTAQQFGAGENTLRYGAWVKKATGATVKEGSFTAVSNFTMAYQ